MNSYIIIVRASWKSWFEQQAYPSSTIVRLRSKSLKRIFESPYDTGAKLKARKIIAEFKKGLPVEKRGGDDGNSKPEIKSQHFARILPL